jgi:hypothetical protein
MDTNEHSWTGMNADLKPCCSVFVRVQLFFPVNKKTESGFTLNALLPVPLTRRG